MRSSLPSRCALIAAAVAVLAVNVDTLRALPMTGGTGPGGIARTDVSGSGLKLWLKADAIQTGDLGPGNAVVQWHDSSFEASHAVPHSTTTVHPTLAAGALNGRPVVSYTGNVGEFLHAAVELPNTEVTSFLVFQRDSHTVNGPPMMARDTPLAAYSDLASPAWLGLTTSSDTGYRAYPDPSPGPPGSSVLNFNGDTTTTRTGTLALGTAAIATMQHVIDAGNVGTYHMPLGADVCCSNDRVVDGVIAEVIMFDRAVSEAERRIVENHLSAKYGIGLVNPASDFYSGDTAHGYDRDVIGVGQLSGPGVISAGAAGFGMRVDSTLASGDFIMAGHAVEENNLLGFEGPSSLGVTHRWERAWFVDDNGADHDLTLAFNFEDSGLASLASLISNYDGDFHLLYSPTNAFSWQVLSSDGSFDGQTVSFGLSDLESGFYTLGLTHLVIPEPSSGLLLLAGAALALRRRSRRSRN